ncbi:MAG: DUF1624 domain-containing protein [Lachnospiraceae bacterium]|nr:DUF1624 domain-containing protein [Lachnospiraceae bacterium]
MDINKIISKDKVNTGRQREVDALKAFSIIMMIITHCIDDLYPGYENHFLSYLINDYLAQTIGAQGFMICMGIGMIYSRHAEPKSYVHRGVNILIIGQLLNLIRYGLIFCVSYAISGDPLARAYSFLVFSSDILQFAGLFLILSGLIMQLKLKPGHVFALSVVLNIIGMGLAGRIHTGSYALDQLLGMFIFTNSESYFPLFNWFIFPAFGMLLGELMTHVTDKKKFYALTAIPCLIVSVIYYYIAIGYDQPVFTAIREWKSFCYMRLPDALAMFFINTLVLCIWFLVTSGLSDKAMEPVRFVSRNINRYYCVHSVFVYIAAGVLGLALGIEINSPAKCYLTALIIFICTTVTVWFYEKYMVRKCAEFFGRHKYIWYAIVIILSVAVCVWSAAGVSEFPNIVNDYLE